MEMTPESVVVRENSYKGPGIMVCADCAEQQPECEVAFASGAAILLCRKCVGELKAAIERFEGEAK